MISSPSAPLKEPLTRSKQLGSVLDGFEQEPYKLPHLVRLQDFPFSRTTSTFLEASMLQTIQVKTHSIKAITFDSRKDDSKTIRWLPQGNWTIVGESNIGEVPHLILHNKQNPNHWTETYYVQKKLLEGKV